MTTTISNTDHIKNLLENRGVRVITKDQKITRSTKQKVAHPRKAADHELCSFCSQSFNVWGLHRHEDTCPLNPNRSYMPTTKCEKCKISITNQSVPSHSRACDGDPEKPILTAIAHERNAYLKALGKNRRLRTKVPEFITDRFENEMLSRGMPENWSIDEYFRLVKKDSLTAKPAPAIVKAPESPLLKAAKAMPENSVAEALQELLAEEMGAMRLVKHIDKFMQWQDLTKQLLEV